jgi:hypothetical protein
VGRCSEFTGEERIGKGLCAIAGVSCVAALRLLMRRVVRCNSVAKSSLVVCLSAVVTDEERNGIRLCAMAGLSCVAAVILMVRIAVGCYSSEGRALPPRC